MWRWHIEISVDNDAECTFEDTYSAYSGCWRDQNPTHIGYYFQLFSASEEGESESKQGRLLDGRCQRYTRSLFLCERLNWTKMTAKEIVRSEALMSRKIFWAQTGGIKMTNGVSNDDLGKIISNRIPSDVEIDVG